MAQSGGLHVLGTERHEAGGGQLRLGGSDPGLLEEEIIAGQAVVDLGQQLAGGDDVALSVEEAARGPAPHPEAELIRYRAR